jgi:hypothetical protein
MREAGTSKPVGCVAMRHRDAERCVSASATRPSSHRFGHGLQARPSAATVSLPVLDRRRLTWRPTGGRAAGSGDLRRTKLAVFLGASDALRGSTCRLSHARS